MHVPILLQYCGFIKIRTLSNCVNYTVIVLTGRLVCVMVPLNDIKEMCNGYEFEA